MLIITGYKFHRFCSVEKVCLPVGQNPEYGFTSFDDFGWSLLSGFRLFTHDYWEGLYYYVRATAGAQYIFYFVVVLTSSLCLLALFPSVFLLTLFEVESKEAKKKSGNADSHVKNGTNEGRVNFSSLNVENGGKDNSRIQVIDMDNYERNNEGGERDLSAKKNRKENVIADQQPMKTCFGCEDTRCYSILCLWSCCQNARDKVAKIAFDPFVELFVSIVVIFNIVSMSLDAAFIEEHYIPPLKYSILIMTLVLLIEALLKIFAMSPGRYFRNCWNIIDFIIIVLAIENLVLGGVVGFSFIYLQLGVVKLARLWPSMNQFFAVIGKCAPALWSFMAVIVVILSIFSGIGMQTFGWYYRTSSDLVTRWHYIDFIHSWLGTFRAFCGEWIETAWDCMAVYGVSAVLFFIIAYVVGHLILIYMFLAFLINAGSSKPSSNPPADDSKIIYDGLERFAKFGRWIQAKCLFGKASESGHVQMENEDGEDMELDIIQILQEQSRPEDAPPRCCPDPIYSSSICWNNHSRFGQKVRKACYIFVQKSWFEHVVSFIVIVYCVFLALDYPDATSNPGFRKALFVIHYLVGALFFLEMLIRWTGIGMKQYFCDAWCWIDFVVVLTFVIEFFLYQNGHYIHPFLHAVRVIRIFRLLRELYVFESARVVLNTLVLSFPGMLNVFIMGAFYWLMFAMMFVQFFMEHFYHCVDENGDIHNSTFIPGEEACKAFNYTWRNADMHFDNLLEAYFSLLHIAGLKGWIHIAHAAMDSREMHDQPEEEVNIYMVFTIVFFLIFCSFVTYSILIGVIIDGFNRQREMTDNNLEGLSKGEKIYCHLKRKLAVRTLAQSTPKFGLQAKSHILASSDKFDLAMTFLILLSLIVLALMNSSMSEMTGLSHAFLSLYGIFLVMFAIECAVKLFAFRLQYFRCAWNIVDLIAISMGFIDIIIDLKISHFFFPPLLLRIFRIPRRLGFLKTCNKTFKLAFPRLLTVSFIIFLVIYVFAVFGLGLSRHSEAPEYNRVFWYSSFRAALDQVFQMGFVLATGDKTYTRTIIESVFIVSVCLIVYVFLLAILLVFVIVSYQEASEKVEDGLDSDDILRFYVKWKEFDSLETGFIKSVDLHAFLNGLEKPLHISNPNKYKIGSLDIPVCKDDMMHHADVLDAVIRNFLSEKGLHIRFEVVEEKFSPPKDHVYEPISSTLWRQREQLCAHVIQKWWKFVKQKKSIAIN